MNLQGAQDRVGVREYVLTPSTSKHVLHLLSDRCSVTCFMYSLLLSLRLGGKTLHYPTLRVKKLSGDLDNILKATGPTTNRAKVQIQALIPNH